MSWVDILLTGIIAIGIVGAIGTRATDLANVTGALGRTTSGLEETVQKG